MCLVRSNFTDMSHIARTLIKLRHNNVNTNLDTHVFTFVAIQTTLTVRMLLTPTATPLASYSTYQSQCYAGGFRLFLM
jgi:hypothetical protein